MPWINKSGQGIVRLSAQDVSGVPDGTIFFEQLGSGGGDLYIIQGHFDMGDGHKLYNFTAARSGNGIHHWSCRIEQIGSEYLPARVIRQNGVERATKIIGTLPTGLSRFGFDVVDAELLTAWQRARMS
jgi:hypothetical protein